MRTLTIGVLIVSGGTLAALPFRRTQPVPDASASRTEVTGPTRTALDSPPRLASRAGSGETFIRHRSEWESAWISGPLGVGKATISERSRDLEMPLTYDDLAGPIDRPAALDANFGALVENQPNPSPPEISPRRESQTRRFAAARQPIAPAQEAQPQSKPQPRFDFAPRLETEPPSGSLPSSGSEPLPSTVFAMPATESHATEPPAEKSPAAGGSLASSPLERLPKPDAVVSQPGGRRSEPESRTRHWIRQPDF